MISSLLLFQWNAQFVAAMFATFSPLIPLSVYWITRRDQDLNMRNLGFLIFIGLVNDSIGMANYWIRSMPLKITSLSIYFLVFSYFLVIFYKNILPARFKTLCYAALIILIISLTYFTITDQNGNNLEKANVVQGIAILIFSLLYFYVLMIEMPAIHIQRLPLFWINTAFLIYQAATLILFIVADYLYNHNGRDTVVKFWIFHNFINVTQNILFAIGLWQVTRKIKST